VRKQSGSISSHPGPNGALERTFPMSILSRFFAPPNPPLTDLWRWITGTARQPDWYLRHGVEDTVDGRFDMVALVTSLVLLRLEQSDLRMETALLTERFVEDMDGSLRDIGIGDMVIGKHVGRMVGALGGRLGAYRNAFAADAEDHDLAEAIARNVYRSEASPGAAEGLAAAARVLKTRIDAAPVSKLLAGEIG